MRATRPTHGVISWALFIALLCGASVGSANTRDGAVRRATASSSTRAPGVRGAARANASGGSASLLHRPTVGHGVETAPHANAVAHAVANVPGLTHAQANVIFHEAFSRGSSVVLGGSRVRGDHHAGSDLDVGFGHLSVRQAVRVMHRAEHVEGGLPIEHLPIVPGNSTATIATIHSPEEFFMRSGMRAGGDLRAGEPYHPSGYIAYHPDGAITHMVAGEGKRPRTLH